MNDPFDQWPRGQQVRAVLLATNKPDRRKGLWRTAAEYASQFGTSSRRVSGILRSLEHQKLVERRSEYGATEKPERWASTTAAERAIQVLGE